ncbi:VCBS domain-containing protein, partial [Rhodobacteraceae bacterium KMM 6894]|nr:VCBS domain-containing protein [Rhodobacteraceae bacterium KMM 6894]
SGVAIGTVTEDTTLTVTDTLSVADLDATDTHTWTVEGSHGAYGSLSTDQSGTWSYALDNTNAAVQALAKDETLTDTI